MNSQRCLLKNPVLSSGAFRLFSKRFYSSDVPSKASTFDITSADETPQYIESLTEEAREEIMRKRLKSGLNENHRKMINGVRPLEEDLTWFHKTIRYKKRMLGRYGMGAMREQIGAVWATKSEIEDKLLIEKTAYPKSLQERWQEIEERHKQEEEETRRREEQITKNLAMVGKWESELMAKLAKKEAALQAAKERKARLVEEVRRQFGFAVDPRDERFKQMLEQKEKEDKKRKKEAKKQERAAKFISAMMDKAKSAESGEGPPAENKKESEQVQKEPENKS